MMDLDVVGYVVRACQGGIYRRIVTQDEITLAMRLSNFLTLLVVPNHPTIFSLEFTLLLRANICLLKSFPMATPLFPSWCGTWKQLVISTWVLTPVDPSGRTCGTVVVRPRRVPMTREELVGRRV